MSKSEMSRSEREDLQRLIRQREKVLKDAAKQRSAELLADFENQLGSEYGFDKDEIWAEATRLADKEVERANERIAIRCQELGIPRQFSPGLSLQWRHRGYSNSVAERRNELRKMAATRIEAIERKALTDIALLSVKAQTEIATHGLTTEAARGFVGSLPSIEELMPSLSFDAIAGEADPPVAEQLVSPGALRQRRYRERHSNALVTSRDKAVEGEETK